MAQTQKPTSSFAPLDDEVKPWKIKAQIIRVWKGTKKEPGNSFDMVLLESSGTQIHATLDDAYVKRLLEPSYYVARERKDFSKWIMDIDNEKINESDDDRETEVDIREDLSITECRDPIETIAKEVYGESFPHACNLDFLQKRGILCATNDDVEKMNDYMLSQLPGKEEEYFSADSISPSDAHPSDYMMYPPELLNSIKVAGLPNHCLRLKVGAPVMLLRDIDPSGGLRTGTRLSITRLGRFVLEAQIMTGDKAGEKVLIPRIPSETTLPLKMRRKQFPLTVAFAMTINKGQGQGFSRVGLFLPRRVFSRGELYLGISKVKSIAGLKILITDDDEKPKKETKNVVFKEVFGNV